MMKRMSKSVGAFIILIAFTILIIWHFSPLLNHLFRYGLADSIYGETFSTMLIALPYLTTISIFAAGLFLAGRERYVHGFRNADLNFFEQTFHLNDTKKPSEAKILVKKGQMWLRVSESYRRNAVYLSFSSIHMILATLCFIISLIVSTFSKQYFVLPMLLGIIFFILSLLGHIGRYGYGRIKFSSWWSLYKRFSWTFCNGFPPFVPPLVVSHLARWKEIGEAIQKDERFMLYLERLDEYRDLKEFPEYIEPQKVSFFNF